MKNQNNKQKVPFGVLVVFGLKMLVLLAVMVFAMVVLYDEVSEHYGSVWGVVSIILTAGLGGAVFFFKK